MNERGIFVVVGSDGRAKHEVLRGLLRRDAHRFHRARQPSLRRVDPILNVDRRQIRIARQIKGHQNLARPVIAAGRSDVLHPLGAIDLLLQGNGDRAFHRLRARARCRSSTRLPAAEQDPETARSAALESPPFPPERSAARTPWQIPDAE